MTDSVTHSPQAAAVLQVNTPMMYIMSTDWMSFLRLVSTYIILMKMTGSSTNPGTCRDSRVSPSPSCHKTATA